MKEKKPPAFYVNIALFALFIAAVVLITVRFTPLILGFIKDPATFRSTILSYGPMSVLVYILFQISHVIIIVIPGEVIQITGGSLFGTFWGTLYSMVGIIIGMAIVFFATRLFGYRFIKPMIPEKRLERFTFLLNSEKSELTMFILFLIPGLPKDALTYFAGITPIRPLRFLIIASIARFPGILGSSLIGHNIQQGNTKIAIMISVGALVLFILGILYRDRIINRIHNARKQ